RPPGDVVRAVLGAASPWDGLPFLGGGFPPILQPSLTFALLCAMVVAFQPTQNRGDASAADLGVALLHPRDEPTYRSPFFRYERLPPSRGSGTARFSPVFRLWGCALWCGLWCRCSRLAATPRQDLLCALDSGKIPPQFPLDFVELILKRHGYRPPSSS